MKEFLRRKILPVFLILALILTMVPSSGITAFAADDESTEEGGETITEKITEAISSLVSSDKDETEDTDSEVDRF